MKIFVAHATNSNFQEELYKPLRNSPLNEQHEIVLPQEGEKMTVTKEFIKGCDLLIAEVSHPSTGQGIELGWADALDVPIICIYKEGANISGALSNVCKKFLMYTSSENMVDDIEGALKMYE